MDTNTTAPLAPGDRVTRRYDEAPGTVVTVAPMGTHWAIAVRLDKDGEVWSGTEVAWTLIPTAEPAEDRATHRAHRGFTEGRTTGPGGLPEVAWFCHECMTGGRDA